MPRQPRVISKNGLYHIIFRGADKQDIFREEYDYLRLKNIISKVKQDSNMQIYAYCFMKNHVHMFIKENEPGLISNVMKKILTSYASWYNKKYNRTGPLTEGRYKSYPVDDESYALTLVKYIHRNPVKAHVVDDILSYPHSSYGEYLSEKAWFTNTDFVLELIHHDPKIAKEEFQQLHMTESDVDDINIVTEMRNAGIIKEIYKITGMENPKEIKHLSNEDRKKVICKIVDELNLSITKLVELTGMSRYSIRKVFEQKGDVPPFVRE